MNFSAPMQLAAGLALGTATSAHLEEGSFLSGGKRIGIEIFRPNSNGRAPALLVLHGASGPLIGNHSIRQLGAGFAAEGYATFLIRYFDRTGTNYAGGAAIRRHYAVWSDTINDAVHFVAADPKVDERRVAALGYSLGGYLAVTQGARDSRVTAVIEIAGGLDEQSRSRARRMPPTLILHGEADTRVPVREARELAQWLEELKAPHEMHLYPGEGHLLSIPAALDALARGHAFLGKHLR